MDDNSDDWEIHYLDLTKTGPRSLRDLTTYMDGRFAASCADNPNCCCALIIAPNTGPWGNQTNEDDILKHCNACEQELGNPEYHCIYRRFWGRIFGVSQNSGCPPISTCLDFQAPIPISDIPKVAISKFRN